MPSPGGCDFLEDPGLDARAAEPLWKPDPDPLVAITPAIVDGADPFSLWSIPGRKSLSHDGRRLLLWMQPGRHVARLAISLSLGEGMAFAYALPAGARNGRAAKAVAALTGSAQNDRRAPAVTRSDLVHMRALHALDAERDGASETEIARLVLGASEPPDRWNDSALRASVRCLLAHGRGFRDGGYRSLFTPNPPTREAANP